MKCFFLYLPRNSTGEICVWVKELSNDKHKIDLKKKVSSLHGPFKICRHIYIIAPEYAPYRYFSPNGMQVVHHMGMSLLRLSWRASGL